MADFLTRSLANLERPFQDLLAARSPPDRAFAQGIDRAKRVARILQNDRDFSMQGFLLYGSCSKRTAIGQLRDCDVLILLDPAGWKTTQSGLYQPGTVIGVFKERLEKTFLVHIDNGDVFIRRQNHSVRVRYRKRTSVDVDVVPAFLLKNRSQVLEIPERSGRRYIQTSISRQIALLDAVDTPFFPVRRGIRLLKLWRNTEKLTISSYSLEILAIMVVKVGCKKAPGAILEAVLRYIAETDLREPVLVGRRTKAADIPKRKAVVIMDPAVPANNTTSGLDTRARRGLVSTAKRTLRSLTEISRLPDGKSRLKSLTRRW